MTVVPNDTIIRFGGVGHVGRPHKAYAGLSMFIQIESQFIQWGVPGVETFLLLVKKALVGSFLTEMVVEEDVPWHLIELLDLSANITGLDISGPTTISE